MPRVGVPAAVQALVVGEARAAGAGVRRVLGIRHDDGLGVGIAVGCAEGRALHRFLVLKLVVGKRSVDGRGDPVCGAQVAQRAALAAVDRHPVEELVPGHNGALLRRRRHRRGER